MTNILTFVNSCFLIQCLIYVLSVFIWLYLSAVAIGAFSFSLYMRIK